MRKNQTIRILAICLILLPVSFSACIKDHCRVSHSYTWYEPVYKSRDAVRANIKSNPAKDFETTGKFYVYGNYIFLNEVDKGIHVIDNSNPSSPKNIGFIDIPGNVDLAVKGNILYADLYTDLVTLDISDPLHVVVKKIIDYVFPERQYGNGFVANNSNVYSNVIVDWVRRDTTVTEDCGSNKRFSNRNDIVFFGLANAAAGPQSAAASSPVGMGGSMARFTIVNNYMYAVDHHTLRSVSISNAADPVVANTIIAGFDIETIYPFNNKLFVGSMEGLYIFDISNPSSPVKQGSFTHARACDPVVADNDYAYVTLRAGTTCGPTTNELLIVNVQNLSSPAMVKAYPMTAPQGLGKDGNILFICDGTSGLKVYNAADVQNLQTIKVIDGIEPADVIAFNNRAMVVAKDGLYQYDYSDINNIRFLSKITTHK